jgi:hypothetical protein
MSPQNRIFSHFTPEPVFVNLLRSPGIDSQPDGSVRQPYLSYRTARLHKLVDRFLGIDSWAPKRLKIRALKEVKTDDLII